MKKICVYVKFMPDKLRIATQSGVQLNTSGHFYYSEKMYIR